MKPVDRAAGSRNAAWALAALACAALAIAGCGGAVAQRTVTDRWLEPVFSISGAMLTDRADATGMPIPGGKETYLPFMFPVSVAANFGAIYIADSGYRRLFRYERASGLMHALPSVHVTLGTLLRTAVDGSLFVLDPMTGELARHSMTGQPLPSMMARTPSSRYVDFAVAPVSGRVFAIDANWRVLDQIEPFGRISMPHLDLDVVGPVALDGEVLLLADPKCRCVNEWRNGRLARQLAAGLIRLPKALVADRGEIYVLDGFDRSISRVFEGSLQTIPARELNLVAPEQISVSGGVMYVADGPSRTVAAFRIRRHQP